MIGSGSESESPGKPVARLGQSWVPAWGRPFECLLGPAVRRGSLAVAFSHLSDGRSVVPTASRMFAFARVAEEVAQGKASVAGCAGAFSFGATARTPRERAGLHPHPRGGGARARTQEDAGCRNTGGDAGDRLERCRDCGRECVGPIGGKGRLARAGEKAIARLKISGWYPNSARTVSGRRCLHMPYSIGRAAPSFPNPPREDGWLSPHIRVFGDLA